MKKRLKSLLLFSAMAATSAAIVPFVTSCKDINYTNGDINDSENNEAIETIYGSLSDELNNLYNTDQTATMFVNEVINSIDYQDYKNSSVDTTGNYQYVHQRGELVVHNTKSLALINKDDYCKTFDYYKYVDQHNKDVIKQNSKNIIPTPTKENYLYDIYGWILQIYKQYNKFFSVEISNSDLTYSQQNNSATGHKDDFVSLDLKFNLKNIQIDSRTINIFDKEIVLEPNKIVSIQIKAENQKIINSINNTNGNYYYGWSLNDATMLVNNSVVYQGAFNPVATRSSYAYPMQFLNLTDSISYTQEDKESKEFLNNLNPTLIKTSIEELAFKNSNLALEITPQLAAIFNSLKSNPTLGKFFFDIADPIVNIISKFNLLPSDANLIISELLKSFHTGKGIISIIDENKQQVSNILKSLLSSTLGNFTDFVDMFLLKINPNMSFEEVNGLKSLVDSFLAGSDAKTKEFIDKLINILLGEFDKDGNLIKKGNPYILDFVDFILIDQKETIKKLLESFGLPKFEATALDAIINIYTTLTERDKINGVTDTSKNTVNFKVKVIDKLFEINKTDNKITWWLMDNLITILNGFGINVGNDNSNLIFNILNQIYSDPLNTDNLNVVNVKAAIAEISKALNFLSDSSNYKIEKKFNKLDGSKDINYDSKNHTLDVDYTCKIVFTKPFEFNIDTIINCLPSDIFLELSQLLKTNEINAMLWKLNTVDQYVRINLERLIYGFLPKKISINPNDAFVTKVKANKAKLLYSQYQKDFNWYNGFSTILEQSYYFEQAKNDNGIISSALANMFKKEYYNNTDQEGNYSKNQYKSKDNLGVHIKYEDGKNKQTEQNKLIGEQLIGQTMANKITTSVILNGYDNSKVVGQDNNNGYYSNNTFKWLDTDLTKDLFSTGSQISYKGQKFDEYKNMIVTNKIKENAYSYNYVSNSNGDTTSAIISSNKLSIDKANQQKMSSELFTIGNGINADQVQYSINPITSLNINKTINLGVGKQTKDKNGEVKTTDLTGLATTILKMDLNIQLVIDFIVYKVDVLLPEFALDLSSNNINYSNQFSKHIYAPRIFLKTPNI